jgi:hypothetical protein
MSEKGLTMEERRDILVEAKFFDWQMGNHVL